MATGKRDNFAGLVRLKLCLLSEFRIFYNSSTDFEGVVVMSETNKNLMESSQEENLRRFYVAPKLVILDVSRNTRSGKANPSVTEVTFTVGTPS